jgi:hypothetical protein
MKAFAPRPPVIFVIGVLVLHTAPPASTFAPRAGDEAIARFLQSDQPALVSYRALRHLEASTRGGAMQAALDAWTTLGADGTFAFEIVHESGSDLIRGRVLRAALVEEQRARMANELDAAALTWANYDLRVSGEGGALVRIELLPKRRSQMLILGAAFVTAEEGDLVRVEGVLAKRPSLWTRHVEIARRYARVGGVRVPVEMKSRADVLLVGASSFAMSYDYESINGSRVDAAER